MATVERDPSLYRGCAEHYLVGRPPYSARLGDVIADKLGLDGRGDLVDVGCGPGVLAVQLARWFDHVVGIDPDPEMLDEARRHALASGCVGVQWRVAAAEDLGNLGLAPARVVTFGPSFHWTDRDVVADAVHDLLVPGGAIVLVTHDIDARTPPPGTGDPPIPHGELEALIGRYLGPDFRSNRRRSDWTPDDRYERALARSRFGHARTIYAPGREDLTLDIDGVISGYLSTSFAAPPLFGARLEAFLAEARALLEAGTPTGRFWDWPGDTAVIIATKPS